jgi:polyphenol oxidase
VIRTQQGEPWIFPEWPAPVRAVVTTRWGPGLSEAPFDRMNLGLRSGDDAETVQGNRRTLVQALDLPHAPRWLRQVHGTQVATLGPLPADGEPEADAAVSHMAGTVLAILTADCLPVLLAAVDGSEIGAAHAGWRGLAAGVLEATVATMGSPASRLMAWLGPCIGAASYEVGEDVREAFVAGDPGAGEAFEAGRPGHWQCDLAALAARRLRAAGVTHIHGGGFDTFRDPGLYSYRRDGARSGRFASLIWLPQASRSAG